MFFWAQSEGDSIYERLEHFKRNPYSKILPEFCVLGIAEIKSKLLRDTKKV